MLTLALAPWAIGILGAYALVSLVTFISMAADKHAASRGARRTPERTLHLLELLGGWPGSLAAQRLLRHKNRDVRYQIVFWLVVAAHGAFWVGAAWWLRR